MRCLDIFELISNGFNCIENRNLLGFVGLASLVQHVHIIGQRQHLRATHRTGPAVGCDLQAQALPRRLGVIGHSEGGLVTLYATATGVIEPKVIVLIATAGRPFDVLLREQLLAADRGGDQDRKASEIPAFAGMTDIVTHP